MKYLWDQHMHSSFSDDSDTPPSDMVARAEELGLGGLTFTDHLDWDYREKIGRFDLDLPRYEKEINEIKTAHKDATDAFFKKDCGKGCGVLYGLELGLQEHLVDRHKKLLQDYHYDFVIGSIHVVHGVDPYYAPYYEGRTVKESYDEYFLTMIDNLQAFPYVDTLGHLDYIARYGRRHVGDKEGLCPYEKYKTLIDPVLDFIIQKGICLEVNSGAYRCNMTEPNPESEVLKAYYKMGGRKITLGADAHFTEHVALEFGRVRSLLKDIGFSSYFVFRDRTPYEFPL